jgi:hypothetical protein
MQIDHIETAKFIVAPFNVLHFKDKNRLVDVQLVAVNFEDEITTVLDGTKGPKSHVAAEIEHALAFQRPAEQIDELVEEIVFSLGVAVDMPHVENRRFATLEIKLIMPS